MLKKLLLAIWLLFLPVLSATAQKEKAAPICRQVTFAALKPLPKLEYACPEGLNGYDEKILKLPARIRALHGIVKDLQEFTNPAWWGSDVDELNACTIHGSAGELTDDEKERWKDGDYSFALLGNHQMRIALLADPCYQTGFAGANAFLLYRDGARVAVSQVLNGYYSRVDNSVGFDVANLSGRQVIEISTANSMPPSLVSYFFVIDPATKIATPKKLFKDGNTLKNEVYSAMLMGEPKEFGLPKDATELNIIRNARLAPTFSAYEENERGKIDADGRKLRRIVYRWNGRFYAPAPNLKRH